MHWDGTVSLGNLLTILVMLWPVIRFTSIIKEFPPHRHEGNSILYPKGMSPDRSITQKEK